MPEFYRFFDSTVDDEREYTADDFAEYFRTVLTDGIFNGGTNLKVSADGTNMDLNLVDGYAWLQGYMYKVQGGHTLTIDTAEPVLDRIDRIVLRLDKTLEQRNIKAIILKGTPAASPVVPALTRDENIFDISLAQVRVIKGKSFIEGSQITDERLNTSVCGLVNSLIQADTTEIFNQFQAWYNSKTAEFQQEWDDWFSLTTNNHEVELTTWFTGVQNEWDTWFSAQQQDGYVIESQRNQPNGFLGLGADGKANPAQLPTMNYIPTSDKGKAGGVAALDSNMRVVEGFDSSYSEHTQTGFFTGQVGGGSSVENTTIYVKSFSYPIPATAKDLLVRVENFSDILIKRNSNYCVVGGAAYPVNKGLGSTAVGTQYATGFQITNKEVISNTYVRLVDIYTSGNNLIVKLARFTSGNYNGSFITTILAEG